MMPQRRVSTRKLSTVVDGWIGELELPELSSYLITEEELRATVTTHRRTEYYEIIQVERLSKWERLVRSVGYVLRFCRNLKRRIGKHQIHRSGILSSEELLEAGRTIICLIQCAEFPEEHAVRNYNRQSMNDDLKVIKKISKIYELCPIIGIDGAIRNG